MRHLLLEARLSLSTKVRRSYTNRVHFGLHCLVAAVTVKAIINSGSSGGGVGGGGRGVVGFI